MNSTQSEHNLVWLDLEMTGLLPEQHTILEIATLITNNDLHVLAEGPALAVHHAESVLDEMEPWSRDTHTRSGLLNEVRRSKYTMTEAERLTIAFIGQYCPPGASPLCGNSVGHDRRFLARYMPELYRYLHYRNIDVSSVKELVNRWYPSGPKLPDKKSSHLALEDIRESVNELIFYRDHYFVKAV